MIENLEYNTVREDLIIPEYGRHIQKMINYASTRETKEERNKLANAIISVMGNLQPHLRDVADFQHKLWDQLFIMSDFKLDADSPFEKPSKEILNAKPEPLSYPQNFPKYRFYGNNIKIMIDEAVKWDSGEMKDALVLTIANHMKKCFLNWNKDSVKDQVIFDHLYELSETNIDIRDSKEELLDSALLLRSRKKFSNKKFPKKNNKNRKRY
ncbi:MAG: methionyl-tRNA formyltransferase [Flavobacteriaceae bacterium]|nr:methionyl-tRNA formyltransferase [Flavobacteriaceae bacterium]OUV84452.1 MAG: methionyl-tRNA formyltransferase [Flavobacteriaceae bacterium TMED145]